MKQRVILFFCFFFAFVGGLRAAVVYDQESQWHSQVKTRVIFSISGNTLTWTISHVSSYTSNGGYGVHKNGVYVSEYSNNPFGSTQTGSVQVAHGDVIGALFASYTVSGPHVVTVTPTVAGQNIGISQTFTASGGQNGYVWQADSGVTITGTGATVTVAGSVAGMYSISVYSPAGNGYAESNAATATFNVTEADSYFIDVNETNMTNVTLLYRVMWKGSAIATFELAPGQAKRERYEVSDATPGSVEWAVKGFTQGDTIWMKDNNPPVFNPGAPIVPVVQPPSTPYVPPTTEQSSVPPAEQAKLPGQGATKDKAKGVWSAINAGNKDAPVTAEQTAEGTEKVVSAVKDVGEKLESNAPMVQAPEAEELDEDTGFLSDASSTLSGNAIASKLPAAPVVTYGGTSATLALRFDLPRIGAAPITVSPTFDASNWGASINVIRNMARGMIAIVFFFLYVRTIKSAFAGQ